ncbi:P22 phage major capsid protein family protein [Puniceicoccus vermicola]|uniref:Uncharacterized protein n=1 Tax=Puniceicoccus vermicola TaxID=388746 RepID=A0A7X1AYF2_9BACT|nr:P22 phage major capsid protein family protein [Puniceicoccus vermicola]MBC2602079.1 hypothetical protein [Puniceicoccus vermicola]
MANTFYTNTEFFDKGLSAFAGEMSFIEGFSTKFEVSDIAGSSVSVPLIDAGSAGVFSGVYQNDSDTMTEIDVGVTHVYKKFSVNVTEASTNAAATLENLYVSNMRSFAAKVSETILADVANYTDAVTGLSVGSFDFDDVKSASIELDDNGVPMANRSLVLSPSFNTALLPSTSDNLKLTPEDYGFASYRNAYLPSGVHGIATHAGSYACAVALPKNPLIGSSALIDHEVIIEPTLGIPVQMLVYGEPNGGKISAVFEALVGGKVAQDKGVKLTA